VVLSSCHENGRSSVSRRRTDRQPAAVSPPVRGPVPPEGVWMLFAFQALTAVPDSAWQLLVTANLTTKIVLGVTAVLSLYSWFVMGLKYWQFRRLRRQANRFFQALEGAPRL